jgi:OmcA/MtrC family decaheme c-type cytochrome
VTQATSDRSGTLVDKKDGSYEYTFTIDLTAAKDPVTQAAITYEPGATHRVVLQSSGRVGDVALPMLNAVKDFRPDGASMVERREIVQNASCNECHGDLVLHGSRYEVEYCATCHNTGTQYAGAPQPGWLDFSFMAHAIHGAAAREENGASEYAVGSHRYGEVGLPMAVNHCTKCHDESDATPQGGNWRLVPNKNSCAGCHEGPDFDAHVAAQDNSQCMTCHGPASALRFCGPEDNGSCSIAAVHGTDNPTEHNTQMQAELYDIQYEIKGLTVDSANRAVITFRVLKNGAPLDLQTGLADLTGGPSFLMAWALPQDGVMPAEWNNKGRAAAQPPTVAVAGLRDGSAGSLVGPDAEGFYVATTNATFPVGSQMRSVALQGYWSQTGVPGRSAAVARHTISKFATAAGDTQRRAVVDSAKCASCHEWFEGHGGNRVYEVQVCAMCHNPNLSTSGRATDPGVVSNRTLAERLGAAGVAGLNAAGFDAANPMTWPEESNNLREMIHSIHASHARNQHFQFVRDRGNSGVFYYDFSHVTYPGILNRCDTCHTPDGYSTAIPENALAGTWKVPGVTGDRAGIVAARNAVPNVEDLVTTPTAAACGSCHDGTQALNHMRLTGALIAVPRSMLPANAESCNVCHGEGRLADVAEVHR